MNRKTKMEEEEEEEEEEDRISFLPDDILHQILSHIDTQTAIKSTFILSKRWKNLWSSVPALTFHYPSFSCPHSGDDRQLCFRRFIKRVLTHRRMHCARSKVKKLSICFLSESPSFRHWSEELSDAQEFEYEDNLLFKHVFYFAKLNDVEDFSIDGGFVDLSEWYHEFLSCRSLKLSGCFDTVWIPYNFDFLKTLELDNSYKQHYFDLEGVNFLPTYPLLERLILRGHCFDRAVITAPKLEYFELENTTGYDRFDLKFSLVAPKLASIRLSDYIPILFCPDGFPSLRKVDISLFMIEHYGCHEFKAIVGKRVKKLFNLIQKASSLELDSGFVKVLSDFIVPSPLLFENLRHLRLDDCTYNQRSKLMFRCLVDSPHLEECHIEKNKSLSQKMLREIMEQLLRIPTNTYKSLLTKAQLNCMKCVIVIKMLWVVELQRETISLPKDATPSQ